jgi:predicted AAA+ superfamily ATPase
LNLNFSLLCGDCGQTVEQQIELCNAAKERMNSSQRNVFNIVIGGIKEGKQVLVFITGPGEVGKSYLL